jgi:Ca2+-binding RTX toxin-like protein
MPNEINNITPVSFTPVSDFSFQKKNSIGLSSSTATIWTLSGIVLVACADTDRGGSTTSGLGGTGTSVGVGTGANAGNAGAGVPENGQTVTVPENTIPEPIALRFMFPRAAEIRTAASPNLAVTSNADLLIDITGAATESAAVDGGDGGDVFIASDTTQTQSSLTLSEFDGGAGDDIFFGTAGQQIFDGKAGSDIFFTGGGADTIDGIDGNDLIVSSTVFNAEVERIKANNGADATTTTGSTTTLEINIPRFQNFEDFLSSTRVETEAQGTFNGGSGNDLIIVNSRALSTLPNQIDGGNGDDFIISHSFAVINGDGSSALLSGADIFWLRPDQAGDRVRIDDLDNTDKFVVIVPSSVGDNLGDAAVMSAVMDAGWVIPQAADADGNTVITVTYPGAEAFTVSLNRIAPSALTADHFLLLTQAEAEAMLVQFIVSNSIASEIQEDLRLALDVVPVPAVVDMM